MKGFGRDIRYEEGGVFGDNGYVRSNCGRFVDTYDGCVENIPERISDQFTRCPHPLRSPTAD